MRLTLSRKILAGYGVGLTLLALVGGYAVYTLNALHLLTRDLRDRDFQRIRLTEEVLEHLVAQVRNERQLFILEDPDFLPLFKARGAKLKETLQQLARLSPSEAYQRLVEEILELQERYSALVEASTGALIQKESVDPEPDTRVLFQQMERKARTLLKESQRLLNQRVQEASLRAQTAQRSFVMGLAAAILLSATTGLLIVRQLNRSVASLTQATREIAKGRFDRTPSVTSRDELGDLARSMTVMAARLRELDQLKADFVSGLSHELKTPLTSLREAVSLLQDGVAGPLTEQQRRLLVIVDEDSKKLHRLITDLLELSRLEAGMFPLHKVPASLSDVVQQAILEVQPLLEARQLELRVQLPQDMPLVSMDPVRIQQVLTNLLHNAIKFTETGGRITVSAAVEGEEVQVRVADTGRGIPPEELERIFEKFYQVDPRLVQGTGGTGLGLPIAKRLVMAHGGRIWATSTRGQGSVFTFTLPLHPQTEAVS